MISALKFTSKLMIHWWYMSDAGKHKDREICCIMEDHYDIDVVVNVWAMHDTQKIKVNKDMNVAIHTNT